MVIAAEQPVSQKRASRRSRSRRRRERRDCGPTTPEPAGWRSLLCGNFTWRDTNHPKRLWDQLRLSQAYGPWGEFAVAEPNPPRWFMEEWLLDTREKGR